MATCSCPTQFHSLGYRFLNDSSIRIQHIYKVFSCLELSWGSTYTNKICYQLLHEYLGPCLALGWRFLEKCLAVSRCLLLSAVCRSRVSLRGSKYSSIRRFKYLTLWILSKSLVSITDYFCCHYYVIIISNPSCLRNSLLVQKTSIIPLLAQLFLMQHRSPWTHQWFPVSLWFPVIPCYSLCFSVCRA